MDAPEGKRTVVQSIVDDLIGTRARFTVPKEARERAVALAELLKIPLGCRKTTAIVLGKSGVTYRLVAESGTVFMGCCCRAVGERVQPLYLPIIDDLICKKLWLEAD